MFYNVSEGLVDASERVTLLLQVRKRCKMLKRSPTACLSCAEKCLI